MKITVNSKHGHVLRLLLGLCSRPNEVLGRSQLLISGRKETMGKESGSNQSSIAHNSYNKQSNLPGQRPEVLLVEVGI